MNATVKDSKRSSAVVRLIMSVSLFTFARSAAGAVRVLSVALIVHAVSPEDFGTLVTLWVPMVVVHGFCDLGLGTAAVRFATDGQSTSERRSLFATAAAARLGVGLFGTALVVAMHEPLARWLTGTPHNGRILLILALTRPLPMIFDVFIDELRSRGAMKQVSALSFFSVFIVQALSVVFAVWLRGGLVGLAWARLLGDVLALIPAVLLCFRSIRAKPTRADFRKLLTFGWPLGVVYALATLRYFDRPIIRALTSVEHVAAYELAVRLVGPVGLFNIALSMVLEPFVYGHSQSQRTPGLMDTFVRAYVSVFAVVAMVVSLFGRDVVTLLAPVAYHGAIRVLPALAFAVTCEGVQRASGIGADLAKRTCVWAISSLLTLAVGLCLSLVLVPRVGLFGVGVAWVVANVLATLVVYRSARSVSGITLPVWRALALVISGAAIGSAGVWDARPIPVRLALLAGFAALVLKVMRTRWSDLRGQS